jgi:hypothetical protein
LVIDGFAQAVRRAAAIARRQKFFMGSWRQGEG